jgi:hypothetical protein
METNTALQDLEGIDFMLSTGKLRLNKYLSYKKNFIAKHYKESYYTLDTEDDIRAVVDSLVAKGKDTCIYPVLYVKDPRLAVKLGLIPKALKSHVNAPWFSHWLRGKKGTLPEGLNSNYLSYLMFLEYKSVWCFETLETQRRNAVSKADSSMLLLYAPDLVYKGSSRPKTDMSLFRNPNSITVRRQDIKDNTVNINGELWNVVPVTRYATGMKRGLFHGEERPTTICGTFYYHEPESTTLLAYKTQHISFNKTTAYIELNVHESNGSGLYYKDTTKEEYPPTRPYLKSQRGPNDTVQYAEYVGSSVEPGTEDYAPFNIYDVSLLLDHALGLLPSDLKMNLEDIRRLRRFPMKGGEQGIKYYAGELLDLYAHEDAFDQPLCHHACKKGIDILIFTNMVGSFQVVSEVLDTRSREDSFKSLVYIVD